MDRKFAIAWGAAIMAVAVLNIIDVLPDWTTIAAVVTLPLCASLSRTSCLPGRDR